jgi:hypothetical protein
MRQCEYDKCKREILGAPRGPSITHWAMPTGVPLIQVGDKDRKRTRKRDVEVYTFDSNSTTKKLIQTT